MTTETDVEHAIRFTENQIKNENNALFRVTGVTQPSTRFSTRDLLYITLFGVLGGILMSIIPFDIIIKIWYPLQGGTALLAGRFVIWFTLAFGFTKRYSAPILCSVVQGTFEFLLGNQVGVLIFFIDFLEGFFVALVFWIATKFKEENTKLAWGLAGGFGTFFQAPILWCITGKLFIFPPAISVTCFLFAFISGVLIAGLLGKIVRDCVCKAGIQVPV